MEARARESTGEGAAPTSPAAGGAPALAAELAHVIAELERTTDAYRTERAARLKLEREAERMWAEVRRLAGEVESLGRQAAMGEGTGAAPTARAVLRSGGSRIGRTLRIARAAVAQARRRAGRPS